MWNNYHPYSPSIYVINHISFPLFSKSHIAISPPLLSSCIIYSSFLSSAFNLPVPFVNVAVSLVPGVPDIWLLVDILSVVHVNVHGQVVNRACIPTSILMVDVLVMIH